MRRGADDAELLALVRGAWLGRSDRYSELRAEPHAEDTRRKIEMYYIGG